MLESLFWRGASITMVSLYGLRLMADDLAGRLRARCRTWREVGTAVGIAFGAGFGVSIAILRLVQAVTGS
jgi:hypothetical protein